MAHVEDFEAMNIDKTVQSLMESGSDVDEDEDGASDDDLNPGELLILPSKQKCREGIDAILISIANALAHTKSKKLKAITIRYPVHPQSGLPHVMRAPNRHGSCRGLAQLVKAMVTVQRAHETGDVVDLGGVWYGDKDLWGSRKQVKDTFQALAYLLELNREDMNVTAVSKGRCFGTGLVTILSDGTRLEANTTGTSSIPALHRLRGASVEIGSAKAIVFIEKRSVCDFFENLVVWNAVKAIMGEVVFITASGEADHATKYWLSRAGSATNAPPILGIADGNPGGVFLMNNLQCGTLAMFGQYDLCCPSLIHIGMFADEIAQYSPAAQESKLSPRDKQRANKMLAWEKEGFRVFSPDQRNTLEYFLTPDARKAQLECLYDFDVSQLPPPYDANNAGDDVRQAWDVLRKRTPIIPWIVAAISRHIAR